MNGVVVCTGVTVVLLRAVPECGRRIGCAGHFSSGARQDQFTCCAQLHSLAVKSVLGCGMLPCLLDKTILRQPPANSHV